ncbi:MAG: class I SAM-dependent methyltransferase [Patescibacteria group bacterium]
MSTCKVCGAELRPYKKHVFDDRYGYPKAFDISRCTSCGLLITLPPLTEAEIGPLYSDHYPYNDVDPKKIRAGFKPETDKDSRRSNWLKGNHKIHFMLPPGTGRVLDVGCGDGRSLLQLEALGYEAHGIEADENIRRIKDELRLDIYIGTIEDYPSLPEKFDIIIANQLIEHIINLESFMNSAYKLLKPGGTIIMSTPNAGSIQRFMFGRAWVNWHIPYHQQIFTKDSLRLLLEKFGFSVTETRTVSPTAWTLHHLHAIRHPQKLGVKNPYWSGKPKEKTKDSTGESSKALSLKPYIFKFIVACVTVFNRILDVCGLGDCLIITATKQ